MKTRLGLLFAFILLGSGVAADPPKITRVGDVTLMVNGMDVPMLGMQYMIMGTGSFNKASAERNNAIAVDACFVMNTKESKERPVGSVPGDEKPTKEVNNSLDAGDPLTLRNGADTYHALKREVKEGVYSYATPLKAGLKAPKPGLVIDIPGAANGFPAMKDKAFPSVEIVKMTAPPIKGAVTLDTTFTWSNPSNHPSTLVMLTGMEPDKDLVFTCLAIDDGQFNLPASTVADLKAKGFTSGQLMTVSRMASRTYVEGDAQLNIRVMTMQVQMGF